MTKLEQKLIDLGYTRSFYDPTYFFKQINGDFSIDLFTNETFTNIIEHSIDVLITIETYVELTILLKTYFKMIYDLEVLLDYEKED